MSESGKHRRVSSGEFTRLAAHEQPDGSIEYVMEEVATLEEASETKAYEPPVLLKEPEPPRKGRLYAMIGGVVFLGVLAMGWFFLSMSAPVPQEGVISEEIGSFKPYKAAPKDVVAPPKPVVAPRKPKVAAPKLSEEERRAWEMAEQTGQEVIVEDEGVEETAAVKPQEDDDPNVDVVTPGIGRPRSSAGQPPMWKRKTQLNVNMLRDARRANPKQRALLQKLNTMDPKLFKPEKKPLHQLYKIPATPVNLENDK